MTDMNMYSSRNILIEVVSVLLLAFGVYLMDKGTITLSCFMIIYANRSNMYGLIWGIGDIANKIVDKVDGEFIKKAIYIVLGLSGILNII